MTSPRGGAPGKLGAVPLTRVKTYRWTEEKVRQRLPLDLITDEQVDLPAGHDQARKAAERHAVTRGGGRVRGCSALRDGGFTVSVG